ncbi:sec-independent protein translocase protein TATB, chloroplastic [Euphorbia lathyris]|uniref:sec-independent protein translocase protein TATB, chloroplastic n=1 Tax=Euphorbia lathyris TaxID=212925 RepID=UPI0033143323
MASFISTPTSLCSVSTSKRSFLYQHSSSSNSNSNSNYGTLKLWIPQMGTGPFSTWNGLKHLGLSINTISLKKEKKKGRRKGRMVFASLFGVGAPEALVIGVVALLVFGPKGLAEVARNLGKTLRAFQPTIRELQDVSREFKSTLEREIGLDDIPSQTQNPYSSNRPNPGSVISSVGSPGKSPTEADPNGAPSQPEAYTTEDYLKITEEQLKASAIQQQEVTPPPAPAPAENQTESPPNEIVSGAAKETAMPPPQKPETEV